LIQAKVAESRDIEFKRETYGGSDADHAEWLANAAGVAESKSFGPQGEYLHNPR